MDPGRIASWCLGTFSFLEVNMGGMRGLKDDETLYEHMFFGAVFVNRWDPFLSLCLVGSTWVFFF